MDDWAWDDPAELRIRLDVALEHNAMLAAEIAELRERLRAAESAPSSSGSYPARADDVPSADRPTQNAEPPRVDTSASIEAKIALFRSLFAGRDDVYARRWTSSRTGRSGWSPAEADPFDRSLADADRTFFPLTDKVIFDHLSRQASERDDVHIGLYPMLPDDTTRLLVADFDGKDGSNWRADAQAFVAACRQFDVPALAEISRSGSGAHVWVFFTAPVAAASARAMGLGLLRTAMDHRAGMSLASYDRLFPSQDFLPVNAKGGLRFGNLIALPLHGGSRAAGTTLFCDPDTWQPFPDQFAQLSAATRLSPLRVEELASQLGAVQAGPVLAEAAMPARPRRSELGRAPTTVHATAGAMLRIATTGLPPQLLAALKHAAAFHNPEFYRKQKQRFSTFNTPRLIHCFEDTDPDWLGLPRGLRDQATALIATAGGTLSVTDDLPSHKPIDAAFTGILTDVQSEAVEAMAGHATGVLCAPTGSGKTVMGCALIARHGIPTAVVVNRAELLTQWRQRLGEFLDLGGKPIGTLAAGKDRRSRVVDVIMLQTLYRRDDQASVLDDYGLVIVDECHCVGAPASEAAIRAAAVGRWIGLTATPFRADSMDPIITMQLGPIRHEIAEHNRLTKRLVVHPTSFITAEPLTDGASIQAMYGELAADAARNALIGAGIADAYWRGRRILALTNRVEHLERLRAGLAAHGVPALRLYGGLPAVERDTIREALSALTGEPLVVLAIDKVAGEGLDADLDTLFLLAPVSFKGRVIQQVGRIMRTGRPDKTDVEVHDYLDADVPMLQRMHHKRRRLLEKRGFTTGTTVRTRTENARLNTGESRTTEPAAITAPAVTAAQVRTWARSQGLDVPGRGKLRAELWDAYYCAHPIQ